MPSYILRVDRQEPPLYCVWSEVVDDITAVGSREELQQLRRGFADHGGVLAGRRVDVYDDERFDRADETGTSDLHEDVALRTGTWDDTGFVCQQKWLPRSRLADYARARQAGGDGAWLLDDIVD